MGELFEVHLISGEVLTGTADGIDQDRMFLTDLEVVQKVPNFAPYEGSSKPGTTAVILLDKVVWWRILA